MKSKEALKEYKKIYVDKTLKFEFQPTQEWYLNIIEKDLDRLEKVEKALEILKSMGIKLEHYPKSENHPYVLRIKAFGEDLFFDLTNELRYNLLKEVLGNE